MSPPDTARPDQRGFTLVEIVVALGLLSMMMVAVGASEGAAVRNTAYVIDLTTSTHLIEGVVLDLEEEYRLEGFPDNALEGRRCELPRGYDGFRCEYDLLALEVGSDNVQSMGSDASENVTQSPLIRAFCSGGADGMSAVDPTTALANLSSVEGEDGQPSVPEALLVFQALLDPGFSQICGVRIDRMCSNVQNYTSFVPMIIEAAAQSTRKLIVRLSWGDEGHADKNIAIETFITATPEAEEEPGP